MCRARTLLLLVRSLCLLSLMLGLPVAPTFAQGFGGAGIGIGARDNDSTFSAYWPGLPPLSGDDALKYITVDGTVELRVAPEQIRLVLAVTSECDTAQACRTAITNQVDAVIRAWTTSGIPRGKMVSDFINVLPRYAWRIEERDGEQVGIQKPVGFRAQTNLHVVVNSESQAMAAIDQAFAQGVTDVVTFDYWSSQLDQEKVRARRMAIEAAQQKANMLLSVFPEQPRLVNIQEQAATFFPREMYSTFENVLEEEAEYSSAWRNRTRLKAYRPKMTFLDGVHSPSDVTPDDVTIRPEIVVVSTVRLFYLAPSQPKDIAAGLPASDDPFGSR